MSCGSAAPRDQANFAEQDDPQLVPEASIPHWLLTLRVTHTWFRSSREAHDGPDP